MSPQVTAGGCQEEPAPNTRLGSRGISFAFCCAPFGTSLGELGNGHLQLGKTPMPIRSIEAMRREVHHRVKSSQHISFEQAQRGPRLGSAAHPHATDDMQLLCGDIAEIEARDAWSVSGVAAVGHVVGPKTQGFRGFLSQRTFLPQRAGI